MSTQTIDQPRTAMVYPDSDGKPIADNTLQFRWMVTIQGGLDAWFRHDSHVFVAGDLLWYPVEGNNRPSVRAHYEGGGYVLRTLALIEDCEQGANDESNRRVSGPCA